MGFRLFIPLFVFCSLASAAVTVSPQAPEPVKCAPGAVFTPFSLVVGDVIPRLDFCSDETTGTLEFQRLVLREMKLNNSAETASYTVVTLSAGDVARGLNEAAFGDTSQFELKVHLEGNRGLELKGATDGQSVLFARGTFDRQGNLTTEKEFTATLEQEDRIAIADGACGSEGQLESSVFLVGDFSLTTERCRVTRQFGARYTFRKITVKDPPRAEVVLQSAPDLARFDYRYTQHNANDSWTLKLGDRVFSFEITDDLALVNGLPAEVKIFRRGQNETRIAGTACDPLSCHWDAHTAPPITFQVPPVPSGPGCERPWMFFDLGLNTLVDTSHEDPQTHEMVDVHYVPGAREYLAELHRSGYPIGLLVDVPEGWGRDDAAALATTKDYLAKAWTAGAAPMDWSVFDPASLFFPPRNELRKASNSLYLFKKGLEVAQSHACSAVHQATRKKEIALAQLAGMRAYQVGVPGRSYFLPIDKIQEFQK